MNRNLKQNEDMETEKEMQADVVIVGTGAAGLFAALNLPRDRKVLIITKKDAESSDSFLAQGGICVLKDESDYESYFEDTMRAGHYENRKESVDIMIRSSREIIRELIGYGVKFERKDSGREQDAPEAQKKRKNSSQRGMRTFWMTMHLPERAPTPNRVSCSMRM